MTERATGAVDNTSYYRRREALDPSADLEDRRAFVRGGPPGQRRARLADGARRRSPARRAGGCRAEASGGADDGRQARRRVFLRDDQFAGLGEQLRGVRSRARPGARHQRHLMSLDAGNRARAAPGAVRHQGSAARRRAPLRGAPFARGRGAADRGLPQGHPQAADQVRARQRAGRAERLRRRGLRGVEHSLRRRRRRPVGRPTVGRPRRSDAHRRDRGCGLRAFARRRRAGAAGPGAGRRAAAPRRASQARFGLAANRSRP